MLAGNITAAQESKTNITLFSDACYAITAAIAHIIQCNTTTVCCCMPKSKSCSGGRINFLVMVGFNNLDIPAI